jgi:uncharacterized protein YqgC (DUF456 family)
MAETSLNDTLLWGLSIALILAGLAGIVLPALPGTILVLAGIVLGAWIDDFTRVGWIAVTAVAILAVLAWAMDYVAALLGARRAGASRQALWGAAIGTVAGIFMGLVGVLFMPLVGAAAGEYLARRNQQQAVKVGIATWLGLMAGMLAKFVLAFMMIGIFVVALVV